MHLALFVREIVLGAERMIQFLAALIETTQEIPFERCRFSQLGDVREIASGKLGTYFAFVGVGHSNVVGFFFICSACSTTKAATISFRMV